MASIDLPQHTIESLPALPASLQSDDQLTSHLASRFHISKPTAQLSSHAIITLNTYTSSARGQNGGKEGSAMGAAEDLAARAWTRLGTRQENQAVVFLYVGPHTFETMLTALVVRVALEKPQSDRTCSPRYYRTRLPLCQTSCRTQPLSLTP